MICVESTMLQIGSATIQLSPHHFFFLHRDVIQSNKRDSNYAVATTFVHVYICPTTNSQRLLFVQSQCFIIVHTKLVTFCIIHKSFKVSTYIFSTCHTASQHILLLLCKIDVHYCFFVRIYPNISPHHRPSGQNCCNQ